MKVFLRGLGFSALLLSSTLMAVEGESVIDMDSDAGPAFDTEGPFDITQLPQGASVTLPSPATTVVPLSIFYRIGPTDRAQVFRIRAPEVGCAVRVHVYDKTSDEVKTSMLRSGESMIYRFERLNGVRIHASPVERCARQARLVLDSNRPLELGL
jgi:hypothetical protein